MAEALRQFLLELRNQIPDNEMLDQVDDDVRSGTRGMPVRVTIEWCRRYNALLREPIKDK